MCFLQVMTVCNTCTTNLQIFQLLSSRYVTYYIGYCYFLFICIVNILYALGNIIVCKEQIITVDVTW